VTQVAFEPTFVARASQLDAPSARRALDFMVKYLRDPGSPGISLERLDRLKADNLWSGRVSQDLRAIIYREDGLDLLLYVDHHDAAYQWARRRRVQRNARTGAIQVIVAPEEVDLPAPRDPDRPAEPVFQAHSDEYLLSLELPETWLPMIRSVTEPEQLLDVVGDLPAEVADRLMDLASGVLVAPPAPVAPALPGTPVSLPRDAIVPELDDLMRMLDAPLAVWVAFLHPSQRQLASGSFGGPVKVTGSAGTGKTVVALHRARHQARQGKRVLLTSYVSTLCHNLEHNLGILCTDEELSRITVRTVHQEARALVGAAGEPIAAILGGNEVRALFERHLRGEPCALDPGGLQAEWDAIIEANGIDSWEGYRSVSRAGRGRALSVTDRRVVWSVVERVKRHLASRRLTDWQGLCRRARELLELGRASAPYDAVVVDEVQDLSPQALRLVASLAGDGPDRLMVVGDGGQRIFSHRSSLLALGIDVRGRSRILRINYRTTEQIRRFADLVLASADDMEGGRESRNGCRSIRSGTVPEAAGFDAPGEQYEHVCSQIAGRIANGLAADEIAVFARTKRYLEAVAKHLHRAGIETHLLEPEKGGGPVPGAVNLVTMHRAKGLEFKLGVVVDASKGVLPLPFALHQTSDPQDREEIAEMERQLLYVSLTRARDHVLVTWVGEPSELLMEALTAPPLSEIVA
jgi:hypothetical protein